MEVRPTLHQRCSQILGSENRPMFTRLALFCMNFWSVCRLSSQITLGSFMPRSKQPSCLYLASCLERRWTYSLGCWPKTHKTESQFPPSSNTPSSRRSTGQNLKLEKSRLRCSCKWTNQRRLRWTKRQSTWLRILQANKFFRTKTTTRRTRLSTGSNSLPLLKHDHPFA